MIGHIVTLIDNGSITTVVIRTSGGEVIYAHGDTRPTRQALDNIIAQLDLETLRGLKVEYALTSRGTLAWIAPVPTRALNGRISTGRR
jgi:hypothetical protein